MGKRALGQVNVHERRGAGVGAPVWPTASRRSVAHQDRARDHARLVGAPIEADPFNILILNYTMKCPLACDYCCYTCGPRRDETMDLELALSLVDQAAELGVFGECGFTGGEPLVFLDDVLRITGRMAEHGFPFSMISACDWATDDEATRRRVDPLAERGMSVFTVSHDPSHEKWVPRDSVYRVVDRVLHHGVRVVLCGSFYDDTMDMRRLFPEYTSNSQVSYVTRVVLPKVGRSAKKNITASIYPNADLSGGDTCYKRLYHDVTVFWDGEVYPCCSVYNRDTPGISYGNVYKTSLADIWDRVSGSLFLQFIKRQGLVELLKLLRERAPELRDQLPDPTTTIGPCHLCNILLRDKEVANRIHAIFEEEERTRLAALLRQMTEARGDEATVEFMRSALGDVNNAMEGT